MVKLNNGTDLVSYKEVEITIPANSQVDYQNPYNFIRLLSSTGTSSNDLLFRFGASSIETFLTVGIGLGYTETLPSVTIRNLTNSAITIRISEILGQATDDRLTITGTVSSLPAPYTVRQSAQVTLDANGEADIDSTNYKKVVIQNNSASNSIFIFNNNTFEVQPTGTFDLNYSGQFKVYGTASDNISVLYLN